MRNPLFDIVKFIVMLKVIEGHLLGNSIVAACSGEPAFYRNFTVAVSMPLFFAISGYFSAKTFDSRNWAKVAARTIGFVWPLFACGCVFGAILYFAGVKTLAAALVYPFGRVVGGGWFLRTLAIVYLVVAGVWAMSAKTSVRCLILSVAYAGLLFLPKHSLLFAWSSGVLHMLPYFLFGMMCLKAHEPYKNRLLSLTCCLVVGVVVCFEGRAVTNGMSFYFVSLEWRDVLLDRHNLFCFFARPMLGMIGSVAVLWAAHEMVSAFPGIGVLGRLGTTTLGVYVLHEWPIIQLGKFCFASGESLPHWACWPLTAMVFLGCHFLTLLIRKNRYMKFYFFGDEPWLTEIIGRRFLAGKKT